MPETDAALEFPESHDPTLEPAWRAQAAALESRIADAVRAIDELRDLLRALTPAFQQVGALDAALRALAKPPPRPRLVVPGDEPRSTAAPALARTAAFEPPVEGRTPREPDAGPAALSREPEDDPELAELRRVVEEAKRQARGFEALPRTYFLTFEDRTRSVDLIPINRALSSLDRLSEVSLQRYTEGKAMISVRSAGELPLPELERAVVEATGRPCVAEAIDDFTVLVSLLEESGQG
jgi:hypothetical protein